MAQKCLSGIIAGIPLGPEASFSGTSHGRDFFKGISLVGGGGPVVEFGEM